MSGFSADSADAIAYAPVITAAAGGFTNANGGTGSGTGVLGSVTGRYKRLLGKLYWVEVVIPITTIGNATGAIIASLPFTAARNASLFGHTWSAVGSINGVISSNLSSSAIYIYTTTATGPGADARTLTVSGLVWSV